MSPPIELSLYKTNDETKLPVAIQYATSSQKEEIIRLLNHPMITRPEKTKILLNINRFDEDRASQAITNLRQAINDRENGRMATAPILDHTGRTYTFAQLHECTRREGSKRVSFYRRLVESQKMTQEKADVEIAMMHRLERIMALLESGKFQLVNVAANTYYTEMPPL